MIENTYIYKPINLYYSINKHTQLEEVEGRKNKMETKGKQTQENKLNAEATENVVYLHRGNKCIGCFALSELERFAKAKDKDFGKTFDCMSEIIK